LIDGLWSTSGEERIIVFNTSTGYCCWEAFEELLPHRRSHALFLKIQELLADVSEILLRSDHADVALQGLADLLKEKKQGKQAEEAGNLLGARRSHLPVLFHHCLCVMLGCSSILMMHSIKCTANLFHEHFAAMRDLSWDGIDVVFSINYTYISITH
jgi:hypothetical protein